MLYYVGTIHFRSKEMHWRKNRSLTEYLLFALKQQTTCGAGSATHVFITEKTYLDSFK